MKKILLLIISLCFFNFISLAIFTFTVNHHFLDFGSVRLGESSYGVPPENLRITCKSDQNRQWRLQIQSTGDLLFQDFVLPIKNLKWFGTYTNSIDLSGLSGHITSQTGRYFSKDIPTSLSSLGKVFYISDQTGDSSITSGTAVYLQFGVTVPETLPPGSYISQIIITMTE